MTTYPLEIEISSGDYVLIYFSKGHHDRAAFLVEAIAAYGEDNQNLVLEKIEQTYCRAVPHRNDDGEYDGMWFHPHCGKGRGAFPITMVEL